MQISINCQYANDGIHCTNKNVKRSVCLDWVRGCAWKLIVVISVRIRLNIHVLLHLHHRHLQVIRVPNEY